MNLKIKLVLLAVLSFISGVVFSHFLIPSASAQRINSYNALTLNIELNAAIANLKDYDEGRTTALKETLERNLVETVRDAKGLLSQSTVSPEQKAILSKKIEIAELALKDRTKTLDELLFKK